MKIRNAPIVAPNWKIGNQWPGGSVGVPGARPSLKRTMSATAMAATAITVAAT